MTTPPVLTSPLLSGLPGVRHGFFTRRGGVSKGLYGSLNAGPGSADDAECVEENRRRTAAAFGKRLEALCTCDQVHSARVVVAEGPWGGDRPRADGVVAARAGLICGALAADCAPVLIADASSRVVAAVHAGWRGALDGVIGSAVETMIGAGAHPSQMIAVIGPCIGPASYEVGSDFMDRFTSSLPRSTQFFSPGATLDKHWFDLPAFVLWRLAEVGVARAEWIGHDTFPDEATLFSNRRAFKRGESDYGRLLSAIMLEA
jgi:YfiH family protein